MNTEHNKYNVSCDQCNAVSINGNPCHETGCHHHFTFKNKQNRVYHQYKVWAYDVWGNRKEGYEVNDRSSLGYVMLYENWTDERILQELKREGYLNKRCRFSSFSIDGDDKTIEIESSKDGRPLLGLEIQ